MDDVIGYVYAKESWWGLCWWATTCTALFEAPFSGVSGVDPQAKREQPTLV